MISLHIRRQAGDGAHSPALILHSIIIAQKNALPQYRQKIKKQGIKPARKGPDSIRAGIDFLQDYEIIVHPRCVNFLTEINAYMWDTDKYDNRLNKPQDYMNHLMDAMRYAVEDIAKGDIFSFN